MTCPSSTILFIALVDSCFYVIIIEIIYSGSFYNYYIGLQHFYIIGLLCVYILMWSLTKLDFLFSNFFKESDKSIRKKKKTKPL
jgi:hypothetical protein